MSSNRRLFWLYVLLVLFVGVPVTAVAQSELPEWVRNPETTYPSEQFLTGLGSAPSLSAAKKDAKAEIAKIFSQNIQSTQALQQTITETTEDGTSQLVEEVRQQSDVTVQTSAELIGVRIEETTEVFRDGRSVSYALAVLDKDQAAGIYRDRYRENRRKLREKYGAAEKSSGPIRKLGLLAESRKYAVQARQYQNYYAILRSLGAESDGSVRDLSDEKLRENAREFKRSMDENLQEDNGNTDFGTAASVSEIDRRLDELMQELDVRVQTPTSERSLFDENFNQQLKSVIEEQFTKLGFRTVETSESTDVRVSSEYASGKTTKGRSSDFAVEWNISVRLINERSEKNFGNITRSGVTVGLDQTMARSRARGDLTDWLEEKLSSLILEKILST